MAYTKIELQNLLARYKCCLANTSYALMKSEQFQTDNKDCLIQKANYLRLAIPAISRYLSSFSIDSVIFDLENFDLDFNLLIGFKYIYNGDILLDETITFANLTDLISQVVNLLNGLLIPGLAFTISGNTIVTKVTNDTYQSSELIFRTSVFGIQDEKVSGGVHYSFATSNTVFPAFIVKNEADGLFYIINASTAGATIISISDGISEVSTLDLGYGITGARTIEYNPNTKQLYFTQGNTSVRVIDGDPLNVTYRTVVNTLTGFGSGVNGLGLNMDLKYNANNHQLYILYAYFNNTPMHLQIYNDAGTNVLGAKIDLGYYTGFSNWYNLITFNNDNQLVYISSYETDQIFILDSNQNSATFNTQIGVITLPPGTYPRSIKYFNGSIYMISGQDGNPTTLTKMDKDGNTLYNTTISGIDFWVEGEFLYISNTNNITVLYERDFTTREIVPNVPVVYFLFDNGKLYGTIQDHKIVTFTTDTETFDVQDDVQPLFLPLCLDDVDQIVEIASGICCDSCGSDEKLIEDIE